MGFLHWHKKAIHLGFLMLKVKPIGFIDLLEFLFDPLLETCIAVFGSAITYVPEALFED